MSSGLFQVGFTQHFKFLHQGDGNGVGDDLRSWGFDGKYAVLAFVLSNIRTGGAWHGIASRYHMEKGMSPNISQSRSNLLQMAAR